MAEDIVPFAYNFLTNACRMEVLRIHFSGCTLFVCSIFQMEDWRVD